MYIKTDNASFLYRNKIQRAARMRKLQMALAACVVAFAGSKLYAVGAKTPFTTLEAEASQLGGGAVVHAFLPGSPVPTASTPELEASGGAFVQLKKTSDSVSWKNPVD